MASLQESLRYVLLTHLDCDHANGLKLVKDAKKYPRLKRRSKMREKALLRALPKLLVAGGGYARV
ncbi:MBL fold metallo-hydrolase [Campylobacter curvus]|uniref:MBL fold metallo-hydrolase n=1 Tax=Campylobacter curvus TaxID=200 RepID=UPI001B8C8DD8